MSVEHYVGLTLCLILVAVIGIGWVRERRAWNGGVCGRCGRRWLHTDVNGHGGRGYKCEGGDVIWISYPWIDS